MDLPSPFALASVVLTAPGWVRVGIAAPSAHLREAAALELGEIIAERIECNIEPVVEGQMMLPLQGMDESARVHARPAADRGASQGHLHGVLGERDPRS